MDFLNIIVLLGAVQGFIISSLLFFQKAKTLSNKLLAFLILIISLACLNLYFLEIGLSRQSDFWYNISLVVPLIIAMPLGPLVFFYVRSLIQPNTSLTKKDVIHFYPILLDLLPRIAGAFYLIGRSTGWVNEGEASAWIRFIDSCDMYIDVPRWISVSIYTVLAWRILKTTITQKNGVASSRWAKQFVYVFLGFQAIWLLHLIPYITPTLSSDLIRIFNWYPIYIPLAIMVYWLGVKGYWLRLVPSESAKSVFLSPELIDETRKALLLSMERDQLYLDSNLSLNLLVEKTGIQQKTISSVLNQQMGQSFNEFVNAYRVEAVKHKLLDGQQHLTITGIAFECGFNSQATFQRVFKQATGQTPTEFLFQKNTKTA